MTISQQEFEKLPKNIQNFRWALFVESDGHQKPVSNKKIAELKAKYNVDEAA
jgi:hypothetical protein